MLVETYETIESQGTPQIQECSEEMQRLIDDLELEGQQKFLGKQDDGEGQVRGTLALFPYRQLTTQEHAIYKQICPEETKLKEYANDLLPLRVLQVAAHAKETMECLGGEKQVLVVWHPQGYVYQDPILLCKWYQASYAYHYYLLARWGEQLESFAALKEQAKTIWTEKYISKLQEIKAEVDTALLSAGAKFDQKFHGNSDLGMPSFYAH